MEDELNVTYITLYGYEEMGRFRYMIFFILFTVYILASCFNVTIVYLVWKHKNLHEPMYIFIAALLLNSFITNTNVYPKLLIDILSDKTIISSSACLFQFYVHYSFSASDFLLMSAMAYDRYVSICKPLHYVTIMRQTIVSIILALAWIVPFFLIAVLVILSAYMKLCNFTLKSFFCNTAFFNLFCVSGSSKVRSIINMLCVFSMVVLPIVFILFTYTRILIISFQRGTNVRKKAAQTCSPHLIVLISYSCIALYDVLIFAVEGESDAYFIVILQAFMYYPLFNPVVYGLKVKEIYKHLKRLLCQAKMS